MRPLCLAVPYTLSSFLYICHVFLLSPFSAQQQTPFWPWRVSHSINNCGMSISWSSLPAIITNTCDRSHISMHPACLHPSLPHQKTESCSCYTLLMSSSTMCQHPLPCIHACTYTQVLAPTAHCPLLCTLTTTQATHAIKQKAPQHALAWQPLQSRKGSPHQRHLAQCPPCCIASPGGQ